ncbi:MAG: hypothetical protein M5U09_17860 [Gammaproteobacteria bacterium]|nr:hypothetical protein [Gammaproteobacteria bacterium]
MDFWVQSNSAGSVISCTSMEYRRMPPIFPSSARAGAISGSPVTRSMMV